MTDFIDSNTMLIGTAVSNDMRNVIENFDLFLMYAICIAIERNTGIECIEKYSIIIRLAYLVSVHCKLNKCHAVNIANNNCMLHTDPVLTSLSFLLSNSFILTSEVKKPCGVTEFASQRSK